MQTESTERTPLNLSSRRMRFLDASVSERNFKSLPATLRLMTDSRGLALKNDDIEVIIPTSMVPNLCLRSEGMTWFFVVFSKQTQSGKIYYVGNSG